MKLTPHLKSLTCLARLAALLAVSLSLASQSAFAKDDLPEVGAQPASYFFTGKPYDADLGSYTFNARNYNPEINRWTSADPSGFPDGANNRKYVSAPTSQLDALGLWNSFEFAYHYFSGGGDVDLGAIGNGGDIRSHTQDNESVYRSVIEGSADAASYNKLLNFTGSGSHTFNFDYQPVCFSVGNANVRIDWDITGSGSINPLDNIYNYSWMGNLTFYLNDAYVDPMDIFDWFPGNVDPGTPYGITYEWAGVISGTGSYE